MKNTWGILPSLRPGIGHIIKKFAIRKWEKVGKLSVFCHSIVDWTTMIYRSVWPHILCWTCLQSASNKVDWHAQIFPKNMLGFLKSYVVDLDCLKYIFITPLITYKNMGKHLSLKESWSTLKIFRFQNKIKELHKMFYKGL